MQYQPPEQKTFVNTEDIRQMVQLLNQKPFSESLSMVSFDELNPLELLELLNKIFVHLDSKWQIDIRTDQQDNIVYKISEFLRVLNYQCQFDEQWSQALLRAEKKVVYPIFYYLLTRLPELEKRAYLARFLVPVQVPEEFMVDQEVRNMLDKIRDLQAEFQVVHQNYEQIAKDSMNPSDLKKELAQLEQEKEQLNAKINIFKNKKTNSPEFQALLEATNLLRREQEEEARLADKLRQQRQQLEYTDQQLLSNQQKLVDARKQLSPENTPEQMLQGLRNEVKKNREICRERLGLEINQKRKKLEEIERLLSEPPITQNELNQMEGTLSNLRRAVLQMEDKLRREAKPEDDKLSIYKQQAQLVAKKKEKIMEELKKTEEEMKQIEEEVKKKEQQVSKQLGPGGKTRDEFKNYAQQLKDKSVQYKKMKEELRVLESESTLLTRTEQILLQKKKEYEEWMKQAEQKYGGQIFSDFKSDSRQTSQSAEQKGKSIEEISRMIDDLDGKIKEKRSVLQPQIKSLKDQRKAFEEIETLYNSKKAEYDRVMANIDSENGNIEQELKKIKEEVYKMDTEITLNNYQTQVLDAQTQRLNDEQEMQKGGKTLDKQYKSHSDLLKAKISQGEDNVKDLRKQRDIVKENHEPSLRQMNMFQELKKLLQLKISVSKNEQQSKPVGQQYGNMNRLVIN